MRVIKKWKDPMSALTHFIGLLFVIPCAVLLIYEAARYATVWHVVSLSIFGAAIVLLYAASTLYHMLPVREEISDRLRRIDHMMIFILIAGTYTPVCLVPLRGVWGWTLLSLVWGFAIFGMVLKVFWMNAPKWISTSIYVIMGWIVLIAFYPLIKAVPVGGVLLLLTGGIIYTAGAVIYEIDGLPFHLKCFGLHDIFHLFVMGGSLFHLIFMFEYVL